MRRGQIENRAHAETKEMNNKFEILLQVEGEKLVQEGASNREDICS